MEKIKLPRMAIEITTRCNLRCKYCTVGVPTQKRIIHLSLDTVKGYLKTLFEIVDYVNSLEFTGGEPFLHESLPEMIESYMEYSDRFGQFLIVTNGTVKPSERLVEVLEKYREKGVIHISDYGVSPERTAELITLVDKIGIKYRVDCYHGDDQYLGGWVDPGEVKSRNRSVDQLKTVYSSCGLVKNGGCWRVREGKIHICMRSCRCIEEGFIFEDDWLDFMDTTKTIEEKRNKLLQLINGSYLHACDYCNGDMGTKDPSKRIPAGEQINKQ